MINIHESSILFFKKECFLFLNQLEKNEVNYEAIFKEVKSEYIKSKALVYTNKPDFIEEYIIEEKITFLDVIFSDYSDEEHDLIVAYYIYLKYSIYLNEFWFLKPSLSITEELASTLEISDWYSSVLDNDYQYDSLSEALQRADLNFEFVAFTDNEVKLLLSEMSKKIETAGLDSFILKNIEIKAYFKRWI